MYPSVKREIPEFIIPYVVFCDCFTDIYKRKTCLLLTRNLKFFEFQQKELLCSIDLSGTCLGEVKNAIQTYNGTKGIWFDSSSGDGDGELCSAERSNESSSIMATNSASSANLTPGQIYFGKYISHTLNTMKIYVIIQCWDKCIILHRLPEFKGFVIKAEYENVQSFRITHGPIKYCPLLEVQLQGSNTIKTDLEESNCSATILNDFGDSKSEIKQLLAKARSARTELRLHKNITAQSFKRLQNRLVYDLPGVRSIKLEEKQMLARCGDIWQRFTPYGDLVIGIPLVNQCAAPNLTILKNLRLHIQPIPCAESSIETTYRLYQLKQSFEELESMQTFLETEDEHIQANVYNSKTECQLLPESYAMLLVKFKVSQILNLKQCPLLLSCEVHKEHKSNIVTKTPLQIFLQLIDFYDTLFIRRSRYEISFQAESLPQDLLATAIASHDIRISIVFETHLDVEIFENCLIQKFEFEKIAITSAERDWIDSIYFNRQRNSLWFGSLVLRYFETRETDSGQYVTSWKIYGPTEEKLGHFVKLLLHDLLALQCNIVDIANSAIDLSDRQWIAQFEDTLRLELSSLKQLLAVSKTEAILEKWHQLFINLCKVQLKSDEIMRAIKKRETTA